MAKVKIGYTKRYSLDLTQRQRNMILAALDFVIEDTEVTGENLPVPYPRAARKVGPVAFRALRKFVVEQAVESHFLFHRNEKEST